jgi:hypothetical protein
MAETADDQTVICPHCQHAHGDPWEWCGNPEPRTYECDNCGKKFEAWAEYEVTYRARPVGAANR